VSLLTSIYDVAKLANVSNSTVSRVLNNSGAVKEEKRQRVLDAVQQLNYHPNGSARALALKRCKVIGVVVRELPGHVFYNKIVEGIYQEAYKRGYGVLFCINNINRCGNTSVHYSTFLMDKVDGIIFLGHDAVTREDIISIKDQDFPVVLIDNNYNIPGVPSINVNNYDGAYKATRYLIQVGHRHIAHIMGDINAFDADERFRGYRQALIDYNLPYDENLVISGNYLFNESYTASNRFLDENRDFTAVFCANDDMAGGFIKSAVEHGLRIPKDVSLVGFDDINLMQTNINCDVNLTTIKQPRYEMGEYAIEMLVNRIEKGVLGRSINIDLELIVRDSVAEIRPSI
jgi:DNA-binding LacI/PurR family transcriptional regulator